MNNISVLVLYLIKLKGGTLAPLTRLNDNAYSTQHAS